MNRRIRNIFIMIGILILAFGANIILGMLPDKAAENADEYNDLYISNYSVSTVNRIDIENESGILTLLQEDEMWYVEGREDAELDQGIVSEIAYMLTHIIIKREVSSTEDNDNLYGMQTPSAVITTYHEGGLEQSFVIGDSAPVEDEYYLQSSVFKRVYTIDSAYYYVSQIKIEDILLLKGIGVEHENMKRLHVTNAHGEEFTMQRTADDNNISLCYWELTEPFNHDIDTAVMYGTEQYEGMITYIIELIGESVIGSTDADTEKYGLDKPIFTADIYDSYSVIQSFEIGAYGDEENYSLHLSNDKNIYAVSKDAVPFVNYSVFMIAEANLNLINIDAVESVKIDLLDLKTEMKIGHQTISNADGSQTMSVEIDILDFDDDSVKAANFSEQKMWFYMDLVTVKIDDLLLGYSNEEQKIGAIYFDLNSKYRDEYLIEIYEYSPSHYIAVKNKESVGYLVNKAQIDNLAEVYKLLLAGELKDN